MLTINVHAHCYGLYVSGFLKTHYKLKSLLSYLKETKFRAIWNDLNIINQLAPVSWWVFRYKAG